MLPLGEGPVSQDAPPPGESDQGIHPLLVLAPEGTADQPPQYRREDVRHDFQAVVGHVVRRNSTDSRFESSCAHGKITAPRNADHGAATDMEIIQHAFCGFLPCVSERQAVLQRLALTVVLEKHKGIPCLSEN